MSSLPGLKDLNLTAIDSETSHLLEEARPADICEACRISGYPNTVGYSDIRILSEKRKELFKLNWKALGSQ